MTRQPHPDLGRQFHRLVEEQGGASVHALSLESPSSGYMVSRHGSEVAQPGHDPADVQRYATKHIDALSSPDTYVGGWAHGGDTYLDVSDRIDDKSAARARAQDQGQIAMWGNERFQEIPAFQPPTTRGTLLHQLPQRREWRKENDKVENERRARSRREQLEDAEYTAKMPRPPRDPDPVQQRLF